MSTYKKLVVDNQALVDKLSAATNLMKPLVKNIVRFVKCLVKPTTGLIDRQIFSVVLSKFFNICDQSFVKKIYDQNTRVEDSMTIEEFAYVICIFMTDNVDLKIDYVFGVYDTNGDGTIDIPELMDNVRNCKCIFDLDEADKDETFLDLCAMAIETLGLTSEGIAIEFFREKVRQNVLFLAILGQSLPTEVVVENFKLKMANKNNLQMKEIYGNIRQELLFEIPCGQEKKYYNLMLDLP